jgi:hypothetical protein
MASLLRLVPTPREAVLKKDELKETWLTEDGHPQELRLVSLSPTIANGQTGYQVKAEIFIRGAENN